METQTGLGWKGPSHSNPLHQSKNTNCARVKADTAADMSVATAEVFQII